MTRSTPPGPVARFFGWLLMGVGALVATTTGACTLYFLAASFAESGDMSYWGGMLSWIVMVLIAGGLPCLIGVGVFLIGRAISRPRRGRRPEPPIGSGDA